MRISRFLATALALGLAQGAWAEVLAPRVVPLADDFVVPGSPGWCADLASARIAEEPQVIVFGHCNALGRPGTRPEAQALLTVSVIHKDAEIPTAEAAWDYLGTRTGMARLSRSGDPDALEIMERSAFGDVYVLHAIDRSPDAHLGMGAETWRAVMVFGDRFISISLIGLKNARLQRDVALATLLEQCDRIRHANTR